jgi:hypothetical protein
MNSTQDSQVKKFLKQVGNIVAVQAVAGAVTELGKKVWPKAKEKLNFVLDKAEELQKAKEMRQGLNDLVKDTTSHYKRVRKVSKEDLAAQLDAQLSEDPPVDATFAEDSSSE